MSNLLFSSSNSKSRKIGQYWYFLIPVLLSVIFSLIGCNNSDSGCYKTFTQKKGIAHFSFDYPCNWKVSAIEVGTDYICFEVDSPIYNKNLSFWYFLVCFPSQTSTTSDAFREHALSLTQNLLESQIIEKMNTETAGQPVELIVSLHYVVQRNAESLPTIVRI